MPVRKAFGAAPHGAAPHGASGIRAHASVHDAHKLDEPVPAPHDDHDAAPEERPAAVRRHRLVVSGGERAGIIFGGPSNRYSSDREGWSSLGVVSGGNSWELSSLGHALERPKGRVAGPRVNWRPGRGVSRLGARQLALDASGGRGVFSIPPPGRAARPRAARAGASEARAPWDPLSQLRRAAPRRLHGVSSEGWPGMAASHRKSHSWPDSDDTPCNLSSAARRSWLGRRSKRFGFSGEPALGVVIFGAIWE